MTTMTMSEQIHETARIDPLAEIGEDVRIGPFAIVEGAVRIGDGCRIEAHACLKGPMTMGPGNVVSAHAVLGADPQSTAFRGEPTMLVVGDENHFGPFSTVHRGTAGGGGVTTIGDRNTLMTGAHVGHDASVGDGCTLGAHCLVAGHVVVGDGCDLGSHSAIQQRVRLGRLSRILGTGASSKDLPPYCVLEGYNAVVGPNLDGLRRAGVGRDAMAAIRRAFRILHGEGLALSRALARIEDDLGRVAEIRELIDFIRGSTMGINVCRGVARERFYS